MLLYVCVINFTLTQSLVTATLEYTWVLVIFIITETDVPVKEENRNINMNEYEDNTQSLREGKTWLSYFPSVFDQPQQNKAECLLWLSFSTYCR